MLLGTWLAIVADWKSVFIQNRTACRAVRQALGSLVCLGRRTLSRVIWTNGGEQRSWSAEYFLHSRAEWDPQQLFAPLLERGLAWCPGRLVGVAVDDTRLRKTGLCIPQAFYQRDPLSPPFHWNLMRGLRFLQASLLVPVYRRAPVGSRALPIRFEDAPAALDKFTPEQVRQDEALPWQTTKLFYGGKWRRIRYKEVRGVYWRSGARRQPLRLLVVAPTPYRKRKSGRLYYRRPAYLLTTDLTSSAKALLQIYFDRWQIGVSRQGHIVQSVKDRPRPRDSGLVAGEAPWRESKTAEPSDNMLRKECAQRTRLQRAVNADHCCPGDEFWIPGNHLTGRGLAGVFAFPDLNCFRADVAQNRPSASGTQHRQ